MTCAADRGRIQADSDMWVAMSHPAMLGAGARGRRRWREFSVEELGNLDPLIESITTTCSNVAHNSLAALVSTFDADDLPSPAISSGDSRPPHTPQGGGVRMLRSAAATNIAFPSPAQR